MCFTDFCLLGKTWHMSYLSKQTKIEKTSLSSTQLRFYCNRGGLSFGPSQTMQEQNKRYNSKSRSNPLSRDAILDSKAKT